MSAAWNREFYREKASEMRLQATRAETAYLRAMYESIADEWCRQADSIEMHMPPPGKDVRRSAKL
jgi:hypothetical protein